MTARTLLLLAAAVAVAQAETVLYSMRRDTRKCASPICGGYHLQRLNYERTVCADGTKQDECYVAAVDWALFEPLAGLTGIVAGKIKPFPAEDEKDKDLGKLVVSRVFEGACSGGCQLQFRCAGPPEGCTMLPAPYDGCGCPTGCGQFVCGPKVCGLAKDPGPCKGSIARWWYNAKAQKCEQFFYGGCDGNANNFATKEACQSACDYQSPGKTCPNVDGQFGICISGCGVDDDCDGDLRCCSNGCGQACMAPVKRPDVTAGCQEFSCEYGEYCVEDRKECVTTPCLQFKCQTRRGAGEECADSNACRRGLYCVGGKCQSGPRTYYDVQENSGICTETPCVSFELDRVNRGPEKFIGQVVTSNARASPADLDRAKALARPGGESLIIHAHRRYDPPRIDGQTKKRYLYAWELFFEQLPSQCASDEECVDTVYRKQATSDKDCYCTLCPVPMTAAVARRNEASFKQFKCDAHAAACPVVACEPPLGVLGCSRQGTCAYLQERLP